MPLPSSCWESAPEMKYPYKKPKPRGITSGLSGAATQIRTGDLILTKDVLYQLSHSSKSQGYFPVTQTIISKHFVFVNRFQKFCLIKATYFFFLLVHRFFFCGFRGCEAFKHRDQHQNGYCAGDNFSGWRAEPQIIISQRLRNG